MKRFLFVLLFSLLLTACGGISDKDYEEKTLAAVDKMIDTSVIAEDVLVKYSRVWNHSIKSRSAIPVYDMEQLTGFEESEIKEHFTINAANNIPNDFSPNIHAVKTIYEAKGVLSDIENESKEIQEAVSELKDPKEKFEKVYDELLNLYGFTEELIGLSLNPTGSLKDFNNKVNELTSDIINSKKRIEVLLPNE